MATILGYEVASPEQQKRTAKIILGIAGLAVALGLFVLGYIATMEQRGRLQAMAMVTDFDVRCRYIVRNVAKRVSYYDHTGLISCAEAEEIARANDFPLGRVERVTTASVAFTAASGEAVSSIVTLNGKNDVSIGSEVEILYRPDSPTDITEFRSFPIFGAKSIAPKPSRQKAGTTTRKGVDPVGLVILIVLLALAYWAVKRTIRFIRWVFSSEPQARPRTAPPSTGRRAAAPAPMERMNRIVARPARQGFGQR